MATDDAKAREREDGDHEAKILDLRSLSQDAAAAVLAQVARIERRTFPPSEALTLDLSLCRKPNSRLFFSHTSSPAASDASDASSASTVTGYVFYVRMKEKALLHKLCVEAGHRGQGIGGSLLAAVEEQLRARGLPDGASLGRRWAGGGEAAVSAARLRGDPDGAGLLRARQDRHQHGLVFGSVVYFQLYILSILSVYCTVYCTVFAGSLSAVNLDYTTSNYYLSMTSTITLHDHLYSSVHLSMTIAVYLAVYLAVYFAASTLLLLPTKTNFSRRTKTSTCNFSPRKADEEQPSKPATTTSSDQQREEPGTTPARRRRQRQQNSTARRASQVESESESS